MQPSYVLKWVAQRWRFAVMLMVWSIATVLGLTALAGYKSQPGPHVDAPEDWPVQSRFVRSPDGFTLLMFAHPYCPCTEASISELERVLAQSPRPPECRVLFVRPEGQPPGWEESPSWKRAEGIRGVKVESDVGGFETRRFGPKNSGHVLLYDRAGKLLYSGGITPLRAHEGDSQWKLFLLDRLIGKSSIPTEAPVFGCPLLDSEPQSP